jgi:carbon monoxide dehydrogenase subunit G
VRAILRVLSEKTRPWTLIAPPLGQLGPIGARSLAKSEKKEAAIASADHSRTAHFATDDLGLGGRSPNLETRVTCTINRPADEVWALLNDVGRVARCIPGASLTAPPLGEFAEGRVKIKIGPISANFEGAARIVRDEERREGLVYGTAWDRFSRSSARANTAYTVRKSAAASTHVELSIRALLSGPLGQFGRSRIAQDFIARLAGEFARRLEYVLEHGGEADSMPDTTLKPLAFLRAILAIRLRSLFARLFRKKTSGDA